MAKKKQEKPRREITRRQRSRLQKQKRRQRIIFGGAILILVAVLAVVGVGVYKGWYVEDYKPLHDVVLEVNGTEFDMEYYSKMLDFQTSDMDADFIGYMTSSVIDLITEYELFKQGAAELGITISDDEIDEAFAGLDPPLPEEYWDEEEYRDAITTDLLLQKVRDEYFGSQIPQYADQRHIMAMFLEGEALADEVSDRIETGEDFGALAAELSLDDVTREAAGDLGWCPLGVLPLRVDSEVLEESAFNAEVGVLGPPVFEETKSRNLGYWLIEVIAVDDTAEPVEAQLRVILVASSQEAEDIRARLEAGEDFAELASEFSLHEDSSAYGGDITLSPGATTDTFDEYVFDPEVELGVLSPVIRDEEISLTGGYWLIQVVASEEDREIDEENRLLLINDAFSTWFDEIKKDPDNVIVNYLDEEKAQWAVDYVIHLRTGGEA